MFNVQFISHFTASISYLDSVRMALEGGCRWIQLRMKDVPEEEVRVTAIAAKELCRQYHATFIIDDRVELVKQIKADGVHLGKADMPVGEARKILGNDYLIGGTANTFEDVQRHYADGADYIGCGPFRFTTTKKKLSPILGMEGYRNIRQQMQLNHINIPIIAIGGINKEDIPQLKALGLDGIALSGTILRAKDPVEEMKEVMALTQHDQPLKE